MATFTKAERLCSRVLIDKLVKEGSSFSFPPFRITWMEITQAEADVQVMISAPKRIYKRAVDRNRVKRLIREAYRRNKHILIDSLDGKKLALIIVYTAKTIEDYHFVEEKITALMQRLTIQIAKKP
jgi:ribonuclease P protein component